MASISRGDVAILTTVILKEHDDEVWNVKWSHNGQYLASASRDKSAFIWFIGVGNHVAKGILTGHLFSLLLERD